MATILATTHCVLIQFIERMFIEEKRLEVKSVKLHLYCTLDTLLGFHLTYSVVTLYTIIITVTSCRLIKIERRPQMVSVYDDVKACTDLMAMLRTYEGKDFSKTQELGPNNDFSPVQSVIETLVELYINFPIEFLGSLPPNTLGQIKIRAESDTNILSQIKQFAPMNQSNAPAVRTSLISNVRDAYQATFNVLVPITGYFKSSGQEFEKNILKLIERVNEYESFADELVDHMQSKLTKADTILQDMEGVSIDSGIESRSKFFMAAADRHARQASDWLGRSVVLAITMFFYAIIGLFLHKIPFLKPINIYDTIQLSLSKILILAVLSYLTFISVKNYLSHKHNLIVNMHRHDALRTYRAIAERVGEGKRDIILAYAAACIFSPQGTGYISSQADNLTPNVNTFLDLVTKTGGESLSS